MSDNQSVYIPEGNSNGHHFTNGMSAVHAPTGTSVTIGHVSNDGIARCKFPKGSVISINAKMLRPA